MTSFLSRMQCSAVSAFTRVFDALWRCTADPGPRLLLIESWVTGSAARSLRRCAAPGTRERSHDFPRQTRLGAEPVRGRGPRQRCAAAAGRQAAPAAACRRGRPGPSARSRWRADAHAGHPLARLADLLGAARHRQDHGGAAAGARDQPAFRADFARSSPASPTSRRCSRRPAPGARPGRARSCSSTRFTASTARSRTASCR